VSLDDPEARLQVDVVDVARQCRELLEDLESRLLPVERLALEQLIEGPDTAPDSSKAERSTLGTRPVHTHQRAAAAIGLSASEFARILQRIRAKVLQHSS
jgi:hypothetical protein